MARGDLPLHIEWLFDGALPLPHLNAVTSKIGARTTFLSVAAVTASNGGQYTCVATNTAGSANFSDVLNVHGNILNLKNLYSVFGCVYIMFDPICDPIS